MFTNFRKLRMVIEAMGVNYAEQTRTRVAELWRSEVIDGKEQIIISSQGLFEILPDGSVVRVIVHAPQGPYQPRGLSQSEVMEDPERGWHKYHVVWCPSVEQWSKRLRKTIRNDGKFTYPLFWSDRTEYKPELRDGGRALLLCQNCARMLQTQGIRADIRAFNVREFLLQQQLGSSFGDVHYDSDFDRVPNAYSADWSRISSQFKSMRNWICEKCYVDLSAHRKFLHSHHRDFNKANNSIFNLQALCIECHAKEHPENKTLKHSPDLREFRKLFRS
jgi:hypothetical protein